MTQADIKTLIRYCDAEMNRCGLDTPAGREAKRMREMLAALLK